MPTGIYKRKPFSEKTKQKMSKTRKGVKHSEHHRQAMLATYINGRVPFWLGKKFSKKTKQKMSESKIGYNTSEETKRKIGLANRGHVVSKETREKIALSLQGKALGEKNPSWKGGISFNPYPLDWTKTLRLAIRQRDNFTCQKCGITEEEHLKKNGRALSVNHIDFNKENCDIKNLNTLCISCNVSINTNREYWTNYFNNKLAQTIL